MSEIPGIPYGIPTESIDTEKFVKQQQEAEKQMKDHLGKLQAIFDKHTLSKQLLVIQDGNPISIHDR